MPTVSIPAGELNRRVEIQAATESVDAGGYGDVTPTWNRFDERWARIETSGSREFYRASQTYATMTHLVTIRYRTGVTTKMRIKYRDQRANTTRYFGIEGIVNPKEANVILQLACTEAV